MCIYDSDGFAALLFDFFGRQQAVAIKTRDFCGSTSWHVEFDVGDCQIDVAKLRIWSMATEAVALRTRCVDAVRVNLVTKLCALE